MQNLNPRPQPTPASAASPNADELSEQALRCRRLARGIEDRAAAEILEKMAIAYDAEARALKA